MSTEVEVDSKPLQHIVNKPSHEPSLRLSYVPGSELSVADALSRAFLEEIEEGLISDLEVNEVQLTAYLPISQERYSDFQQASADDLALQALGTVVRNGWPSH